jgi:hypothetical protein
MCIAWEHLPHELGFGRGMTSWLRLREWQIAEVWHQLNLNAAGRMRSARCLDFSRAGIDGASVPTPPFGPHTGPNPTDRGKLGSKRHLVTDRTGIPLVFCFTGAN